MQPFRCRAAALLLLAACNACGGQGPQLAPEVIDDPNRPVAGRCERNEALLRSLSGTPVDCAGDDACPTGSHCDLDEGQCVAACIPVLGDPSGGCANGVACDCYGRCEGHAPDAPMVGGKLSFSRTAVPLHAAASGLWARRSAASGPVAPGTVEAHVSLPAATGLGVRAVTFHASSGLLVRCRPGEAAAGRCRAPLTAGEQTLHLEVEADPDAAAAASGPWTLSFTSSSLFPRRGSISVLAPTAPSAAEGEFVGQATACGDGSAPPLPVPLTATVAQGKLTLRAAPEGMWPRPPLSMDLGQASTGTFSYGARRGDTDARQASWQAIVEAADAGGSLLRGMARFGFAPGSVSQWCITLQNRRAPFAGEAALGLADAPSERLGALLDAAPPVTPPAVATPADRDHRAWREVGRQSAERHNLYTDLGQHLGADGRVARAPQLPDHVVFRPEGATPVDHKQLAIDVFARDFASVLAEADAKVSDGHRVNNFADIIGRAWYRVVPGRTYLPCISSTFPSDGALTKVDCNHVLGPKPPQGRTFDACRNTDVHVWHCPGGMCDAEPTDSIVWLCPLGLALPQTLAETVEATLCRAPDAPEDAATGRHSALFSGEPAGARGDLMCRRGQLQTAVPLMTGAAGAVGGQLDACLAELSQDAGDSGVDAWRGPGAGRAACFRPVPFHAALATLLEAPALPDDAARLLQHLLGQWLHLHTYIGNEATHRGELDVLIRGEAGSEQQAAQLGLETPYGLVEQTLERGLHFMTGAAVAPVLAQLAPHVLADPDYRGDHGLAGSATDAQKLGLAVPMLDATASYLRFTAHRLSRAATGHTSARGRAEARAEQIASALQLAGALRAQAAALHAGAASAGVLTWEARYRSATGELDAAMQRVVQVRDHGTDDWSALGFGDDEVPLYFTDFAGANASFFASSDYIFRDHAGSAVLDARRSLERAQANWAALVATSQQEQEGEESVLTRYGRPLRDLCGIAEQDDAAVLAGFAAGSLRPASCFLKPGCSDDSVAADPGCLRGQLGEVAAAVTAARGEVEAARTYVADIFGAHDRKVRECNELQADLAGDNRLVERHKESMHLRRSIKAGADQVANVAQQTANIGFGDVISAGTCRAIATGCRAASLELAREMEELESSFRTDMVLRGNDQRIKACFHEADAKLDGTRSAAAQLKQRILDLETALLRLSNRQEEADRLAAEGAAMLAQRAARGAPSMAFRGWLGAAVEGYRAQLRTAKHMTYLAVRAFEYETQQSSPWKGRVLQATGPGVLEQALLEIHGRNVSRSINERRPEVHHVRVSLRDEVLRLADQTDTPQHKRHGDPRERFSHHLASEASAMFDEAGRYLGQGLVFDLPDLTGGECAERLTHVSARVEGNFAAGGPVSTRLKLYKLGLFGSKWCAGRADADAATMQWRTKPRHELLSIHTGQRRALPTELAGYSVANLDAHADANRHQFATATFRDGSSAELGGQGLYGSYAVVLPPTSTFAPGQVEDIVLRFDYVSVDNTVSRPAGR